MFHIAWPWLLLLLPVPVIWRYLLPAAGVRQGAALKVPFFAAIQSINSSTQSSVRAFWLRLSLAYLIWALLVFAAAGPQWLGKPVELPRSGRDIMLAVDLSGSMRTPDMRLNGAPVTRLQLVKAVANQFIQQRTGDRIGLILFGTRAYLQTPLTFDRKTVQQMLDDATVGLAGPRTAIGDAMGLAIKRLDKYPKDSRILVLMTDGDNNAGNVTPLAAAKVAAENHIRIYTIGLGAGQMLVRTIFGTQMINTSSDLDEKTLREIAKMTGGLYFRAKNAEDLKRVYESIDKLEPVEGKKASFRPITPLYPWPLGAALLLTLFLSWPYLEAWKISSLIKVFRFRQTAP